METRIESNYDDAAVSSTNINNKNRKVKRIKEEKQNKIIILISSL
jgi:hypothetical protein